MKRVALFVTIMACLAFAPASAEQYKEDFNGDGCVGITDVIALLLFQRANPGHRPGGFMQTRKMVLLK